MQEGRSKRSKRILYSCIGLSSLLHVGALFLLFYTIPYFHKDPYEGDIFQASGNKIEEIQESIVDFTFEKSTLLEQHLVPQQEKISLPSLSMQGDREFLPIIALEPSEIKTIEESKTALENKPVSLTHFPEEIKPSSHHEETVKGIRKATSFLREERQNPETIFSHAPKKAEELFHKKLLKKAALIEEEKRINSLYSSSYTPSSTSIKEPACIAMQEKKESLRILSKRRSAPAYKEMIEERSYLPSLKELKTICCSEDFHIDVNYEPLPSGEILFALILIPNKEFTYKKLAQNFIFLFDRSNSLSQDRVLATRHAISASLPMIDKGDSFNIVAFDSQSQTLFERPHLAKSTAITEARKFLSSQMPGAFYSKTEYKAPMQLAFSQGAKNGINHYILLSSSKEFTKRNTYLLLDRYLQKEKNSSFYAVGIQGDEGLATLDYFASSNRGKILTSHTNRGIKRNLLKLIKSMQAPIAKDIQATLYETEGVGITLYQEKKEPLLFGDQPSVILGKTREMKDFTLFLQGIGAEDYFHIKKKVSFENAKRGGKDLLSKWALLEAYSDYDHFLEDFQQKHIQNAEKKLTPYQMKPAF